MILLTGATGGVGSQLLPMLVERGERVKCLVREPSRLGDMRVDVQIVMGDLKELSDPYMLRQALRGVDTVIHLAGTMRDQPGVPLEELNGLATARLVEGAESVGAERFLFFSALGASPVRPGRRGPAPRPDRGRRPPPRLRSSTRPAGTRPCPTRPPG